MKIKRSIKPNSKLHDVSVIIVCRNGKQVTQHCLTGIMTLKVREIIVIDNHSNDGTLKMLKNLADSDPRMNIIRNTKNNGFAEANNQGARIATAKYVLFLNNDTIIDTDFLPPLLRTLTNKKVAAVQPMILFPDKTIDSIGSFLTPTGFLYHKAHRMKPDKSFLKEESVYTLKGACMLWKRSVLEEIGVFRESYFAYFEETELCHRAVNAGYQVMVNPSTQIIHLGGFTSNSMNQQFIQYHNAKNRIHTYLIHFPFFNVVSVLPLHIVLTELLVVKYVMSGHLQVALSIQKGVLIGMTTGILERLQTLMKKRTSLQSYVKSPDIGYYKALFSSLQHYRKVW